MEEKMLPGKRIGRRRFCHTHFAWIAFAALWMLVGCHQTAPTIAVIPRTCGTLLWESEHTGVERVASANGLNVYWNAPMREDDVQGQIDILTKVIARGTQGVIIYPVEALPLRTPVNRALERGTPVVVVGTDLGLTPGKNLAYVLNDEHLGGQMAARRIGKLLQGRGAVAILGISNQLSSTAERARSLEATLTAEFPEINVVFRSVALPTVSQEQQVAERLLAENSRLNAIVALSVASTRGTYYALTEFDKTTSIRLVGFDQNLLAPIRTGGIDSVVAQNTNMMGRAAVKLLCEEMKGNLGQSYVVLPPELITRENINSDKVKEILDERWFRK